MGKVKKNKPSPLYRKKKMTNYEYLMNQIANAATNEKKYIGDKPLVFFWGNAKKRFEQRKNNLTVEEAEHELRSFNSK